MSCDDIVKIKLCLWVCMVGRVVFVILWYFIMLVWNMIFMDFLLDNFFGLLMVMLVLFMSIFRVLLVIFFVLVMLLVICLGFMIFNLMIESLRFFLVVMFVSFFVLGCLLFFRLCIDVIIVVFEWVKWRVESLLKFELYLVMRIDLLVKFILFVVWVVDCVVSVVVVSVVVLLRSWWWLGVMLDFVMMGFFYLLVFCVGFCYIMVWGRGYKERDG